MNAMFSTGMIAPEMNTNGMFINVNHKNAFVMSVLADITNPMHEYTAAAMKIRTYNMTMLPTITKIPSITPIIPCANSPKSFG